MPDEEPNEDSLKAKQALLLEAAATLTRADGTGTHAGLILLASVMGWPVDSMAGFDTLVALLKETWPHANVGLRMHDLSGAAATADLTPRPGADGHKAVAPTMAAALGMAFVAVELAEITRSLAFAIPAHLKRPKPAIATKPKNDPSIFD